MFYAYVHAKPNPMSVADIFYVGKGKGKRARLVANRGTSNRHYKHTVAAIGAENVAVGIIECSSEAIAFELERGLIKCLRRSGVRLTNLTDGGEGSSGYVPRPETRQKIGEAARMLWDNDIRKLAASSRMREAWADADKAAAMLKGRSEGISKSWMDEGIRTRRMARLSEATKQAMQREDVRANFEAAIADPERGARISAALRRTLADPVVKAKRSAAMKAAQSDPIVNAKRSASLKAAWAKRKAAKS